MTEGKEEMENLKKTKKEMQKMKFNDIICTQGLVKMAEEKTWEISCY